MEDNLTGVFDSGVGGLSILKELLPLGGEYIYFGDTKNLPYGNKSKEEIIGFTRNIFNFFIKNGAKSVVMACNTSSALAYETLKTEFGQKIKIYPLIQTVAPYIAKEADRIGILATSATAKSLTYTKEILSHNKNAKVFELACPNFVNIVENRLYEKEESIQDIKEHLTSLIEIGVKKIVLGCTHYPYLLPILTKFAPEEIFINPAFYMKKALKTETPAKNSNVSYYVSGDPEEFRRNAKLFLDIKDKIKIVNL